MAFLSLSLWHFFLLIQIFSLSNSIPSDTQIKKDRAVKAQGGLEALDAYLKEIYPTIPKPEKPIGELPPFRAPSIGSFAVINQYLNDVIPAYFKASQTCSDLTVYVGILMNRIRIEKGTEKEVEGLLMNMCVIRQKPQVVCAGLIKRFVPTFHYIVKKRPALTPEVFVGTVFQQLGCRTNSSYVEWSVDDPFIGIDSNETAITDAPEASDGDNITDESTILGDSLTTTMPISESMGEGEVEHLPPTGPIVKEVSSKTNSRQPRIQPIISEGLRKAPLRTTTTTTTGDLLDVLSGATTKKSRKTTLGVTPGIDEYEMSTTDTGDVTGTTRRRRTTTVEVTDESTTENLMEMSERTTRRRRTTAAPDESIMLNVETSENPESTTRRRRTTTTSEVESSESIGDVTDSPEMTTRRRRSTTTQDPNETTFTADDSADSSEKTTRRRRTTTILPDSTNMEIELTEADLTTSQTTINAQDEPLFPDSSEEKTTRRRRSTTTLNPDFTTILNEDEAETPEMTTRRRRTTTTEIPTETTMSPEIKTTAIPEIIDTSEMTTRRRRTTTTAVPSDTTLTEEIFETSIITTQKVKTTTTQEVTTTKIPTTTTPRATTTSKIPTTPEVTTTTTTETTTEAETLPPQPPPFQEPALEPPRLIKILHMTDLHVDLKYVENMNAACENKVLCCHEDSGSPPNRTASSGRYGSSLYCDTPETTLVSALTHIVQAHKDIDVFYMSGDLIPHNMWYTNKPDNIKTIEYVSGIIRSFFPTTQIIPILGNHEPHPVDLFSPKNLSIPSHLSTRWVYPATERSWMSWIPREAAEEYNQFGHYAIQLQDKYRVLVLNTNLCFGFNLWQLYNFNEFKEQLKWLQLQLQSAVEENQFVHILGHLPPGYSGCSRVFSRNYYEIVANYSSIIGGQFFGHLHKDTFRIYFNPKRKTDPINVQWITPSLTPYKSNNPAYKIYYADPFSLQVIDTETWMFDLEKANAQPRLEPEWIRSYTSSELYNVPNVTLSNLPLIMEQLAVNTKLFETYYRHYLKAADDLQSKKCDTYCQKKIMCRMVRPYFGSEEECERIQIKIDGAVVPVYDEYPIF